MHTYRLPREWMRGWIHRERRERHGDMIVILYCKPPAERWLGVHVLPLPVCCVVRVRQSRPCYVWVNSLLYPLYSDSCAASWSRSRKRGRCSLDLSVPSCTPDKEEAANAESKEGKRICVRTFCPLCLFRDHKNHLSSSIVIYVSWTHCKPDVARQAAVDFLP